MPPAAEAADGDAMRIGNFPTTIETPDRSSLFGQKLTCMSVGHRVGGFFRSGFEKDRSVNRAVPTIVWSGV